MSFQSVGFLLFLAVTCVVCRRTAQCANRTLSVKLLCLGCLLFCGIGDRGASVGALAPGLLASVLAVRYLAGEKPEKNRRRVLLAACLWHITVLALFKYPGAFIGGTTGWAPLGVSFFTFQQLWLLKETYTRAYVPQTEDSLTLFAFFFPTMASGPILRPGDFFPQLRSDGFLSPTAEDVAAGCYAIAMGLTKKVLLADSLGIVTDNGWAAADRLNAPAAWLVMLAYTLQLYLDFSGYCDVAAGSARLLGLRLPANFDVPYRALSVTEFWTRWHMTLTRFLRECVYIPLGGSRRGAARTYGNILLVFFISGLWHGAGWTFLVWGLLHGLAQVAERVWGRRRERLPKAAQWVLTFLFVNLAWVFFRAPSLSAAGTMLRSAVSFGPALPLSELTEGLLDSELTAVRSLLPGLSGNLPALALSALLAVSLVAALRPRDVRRQAEIFRPTLWRAVLCGVLLTWCVLSFPATGRFIYSGF